VEKLPLILNEEKVIFRLCGICMKEGIFSIGDVCIAKISKSGKELWYRLWYPRTGVELIFIKPDGNVISPKDHEMQDLLDNYPICLCERHYVQFYSLLKNLHLSMLRCFHPINHTELYWLLDEDFELKL